MIGIQYMANSGEETPNVGGVAVASVVFLALMGVLGGMIYSWSSNPPAEGSPSFASVVFADSSVDVEEPEVVEAPVEEEESWD